MKGFQMKTIAASTIAAAALFAATASAQAGQATNTFNVTINLTAACKVDTTGTAPSFTYTSGQTSASSLDAPTTFSVQCSQNLPITSIALDDNGLGAGSYKDALTNLNYTLTVGSYNSTSPATAQTIALTGNMPANQYGTCSTSASACANTASTNKTRTITVTY